MISFTAALVISVYYNIQLNMQRNIALHEVGHVLGFGHNSVSDSVMSYPYTEWNLGAGDAEGAIAIYGRVTVPEPETLVLLSPGLLGLLRRRKQAKKPVSTT